MKFVKSREKSVHRALLIFYMKLLDHISLILTETTFCRKNLDVKFLCQKGSKIGPK